jgi:hypothetical protein
MPRHSPILPQVLREQRWAYERRIEHYDWAAMRMLANRDVEDGGLGYDLSEQALRGLVRAYRNAMAEVEVEDLEEHRARELVDLDRQHREILQLTEPVDWQATAKAAAAYGYRDVHEAVRAEPGLICLRDEKTRLAAWAQLRAIGESRRKLLGLDAPQQIKADVVVRDAVTEELNAMLARAGRKPVKAATDDR